MKNAKRTISKQAKKDCADVADLEDVEFVNEYIRDTRKSF